MKKSLVIIALLVLFLGVSCKKRPTVYLFFDPVSHYIFKNNKADPTSFLNSYRVTHPGTRFVYSELGTREEAISLFDSLPGESSDLFIFTMFVHNWIKGSVSGNKKILVLDPNPDWIKQNPDISYIDFEREDAFMDAGLLSAEFLTDKGYCAVWVLNNSEGRNGEWEAFRKGFSSIRSESSLLVHQISDPENPLLDRFQGILKEKPVELYLLFAGEVNPSVYQLIKNDGIPVGMEDVRLSGFMEERLYFSIEDNFNGMLEKAMDYKSKDEEWTKLLVKSVIVPRSLVRKPKKP